MIERDPGQRICLDDILDHEWLKNGESLNNTLLSKELDNRSRVVQKIEEAEHYA